MIGKKIKSGVDITYATVTLLFITLVLLWPNGVYAQEPNFYSNPILSIVHLLYDFVWVVFGWLLSMSGGVFDFTIENFVLQFGYLYQESGLGFVIDDLWGLVRDLFNLALIFAVVVTGLRLIWNADDSGAQKKLGYIILAALLVNFSLFIVKFIIDFSNIIALQIHGAFVGTDGGTIGSEFQNIVRMGNVGDVNFEFADPAKGFVIVFGILILFLVGTFVFLAGAFLLTIRFIALNIYLVFSPLLFLGWVLPGQNRYSQDYWDGLLRKAFFAPAFIFMIYLSYQVLNRYQFEGRVSGLGTVLNPETGPSENAIATMTYFILATGFMIASLVVAQKMGAQGSNLAIGYGKTLQKRLTRAATYYPRTRARNLANNLGAATESGFHRLQTSNSVWGRMTRTKVLGIGRALDSGVKGLSEKAQKVELGTGTTVEGIRKHREKIDGAFATAQAVRGLGELGSLQDQEKTKKRIDELQVKRAAGTIDPDEKNTLDELEKNSANLTVAESTELATLKSKSTLTAAEQTRLNDLQNKAADIGLNTEQSARKTALEVNEAKWRESVAKMSAEDIEKLSDSDRAAVAPYLTSSQAEKVSESKNLTDEQKKAITDARVAAVQKIVSLNVQDVAKLSQEQLELMGEQFIKDHAAKGRLKQSQIDDLKKSKKYTEAQRNGFADTHKKGQYEKVREKLVSGATTIDKLSTEELIALGKEYLKDPIRIGHITKSQMDDLKKHKDFSADDYRELESVQKTVYRSGFNVDYFINKPPKFIANLPPVQLTDPVAAPYISKAVLKEIIQLNVLDDYQRNTIKNNIIATGSPTAAFFTTNYAQDNW